MDANKIIQTGLQHLGTPYVFNAPALQADTFDCSSFIQYIFHRNGIGLPRNSRQQSMVGRNIPFHKIKKGDLLFFTTANRRNKHGLEKIGHVALYLGDNKILHTYPKGEMVKISSLNSYWRKGLLRVKRII